MQNLWIRTTSSCNRNPMKWVFNHHALESQEVTRARASFQACTCAFKNRATGSLLWATVEPDNASVCGDMSLWSFKKSCNNVLVIHFLLFTRGCNSLPSAAMSFAFGSAVELGPLWGFKRKCEPVSSIDPAPSRSAPFLGAFMGDV